MGQGVRFIVAVDAEPEVAQEVCRKEVIGDVEKHEDGGAVLVAVVLLLQLTLWVTPELNCPADLHGVKWRGKHQFVNNGFPWFYIPVDQAFGDIMSRLRCRRRGREHTRFRVLSLGRGQIWRR